MQRLDLIDRTFGRLRAVGYSHSARGRATVDCICACGKRVTVFTSNLFREGSTKSCGCLRKEIADRGFMLSHGGKYTRLYRTWRGMIERCERAKNKRYARYGSRGIRVCSEWRRDFTTFRAWALSHGYADNLTIDRINNDGNYELGNCQWITRSENVRKEHRQIAAGV